jgi:hypothetical protein
MGTQPGSPDSKGKVRSAGPEVLRFRRKKVLVEGA